MANALTQIDTLAAVDDIHSELGIKLPEHNRQTIEDQTIITAYFFAYDVAYEGLLAASRGKEELMATDAIEIVNKVAYSWKNHWRFPGDTTDAFFRNEKLCYLLAQASKLAFEGYREGKWRREITKGSVDG